MLHGIANADAVCWFAVRIQPRQHEYGAWCTANDVVRWAKANHDKVHDGWYPTIPADSVAADV